MSDAAGSIVEALGLQIDMWRAPEAAGPLVRCIATARHPDGFVGFGAGIAEEEARLAAVMECVERTAQFSARRPAIAWAAPYAELGSRAVSPLDFGLYHPVQYRTPGFDLAPFRPDDVLEWVEARDLLDDEVRLVPVEFVHPRAQLPRLPIVAETSNGTAAHATAATATLAAACEAVERDGLLLFWYRQPPTPTVDVARLDAASAELVERLRLDGWVVTVCDLRYDLPVPRYLAVALRGRRFGYGLGCDLDAATALRHALRELATRLASFDEDAPRELVYRTLPSVAEPAEHFELYHLGPLHDMLRMRLASALGPPTEAATSPATADRASDGSRGEGPASQRPLRSLLERLAARGIRAYGLDLTPASLAGCGVAVVRVLVAGLVPMHFGYGRARLGCERLTGAHAPGRFSTLLPHFAA